MFASTQCFRSNPKLYFYDKTLPMGSNSERVHTLFLEHCVNPKGNVAYKNIFEMTQKNEFVTKDTTVQVTPAQAAMLTFLQGKDLTEIINCLENVWVTSLFYCDPDMVHLPDHNEVRLFINLLKEMK